MATVSGAMLIAAGFRKGQGRHRLTPMPKPVARRKAKRREQRGVAAYVIGHGRVYLNDGTMREW